MDGFATEIGAEIYYHHPSGFSDGGITNGQLNAAVVSTGKQLLFCKAPQSLHGATMLLTRLHQLNKYILTFLGKKLVLISNEGTSRFI